jgi:hypothetical protein
MEKQDHEKDIREIIAFNEEISDILQVETRGEAITKIKQLE